MCRDKRVLMRKQENDWFIHLLHTHTMSHRPSGYDKYYMTVNCAGCGAYTGKDYAWRFGESEPTVYCSTCKSKAKRKRVHAAKHPQNHRRQVYCSDCKQWMRTECSSMDNRDQFDRCITCKERPSTPPPAPVPPRPLSNDDVIDLQFVIQ